VFLACGARRPIATEHPDPQPTPSIPSLADIHPFLGPNLSPSVNHAASRSRNAPALHVDHGWGVHNAHAHTPPPTWECLRRPGSVLLSSADPSRHFLAKCPSAWVHGNHGNQVLVHRPRYSICFTNGPDGRFHTSHGRARSRAKCPPGNQQLTQLNQHSPFSPACRSASFQSQPCLTGRTIPPTPGLAMCAPAAPARDLIRCLGGGPPCGRKKQATVGRPLNRAWSLN
jgi:hypothetical protein